MIAVILATGVAFASEYQSDREFEALNTRKDMIQVKVRRGGQLRQIAVEDVVVGDLAFLETGDEIPADGRLVKANELLIDQSLMTGESEPVAKKTQGLDEASEGFDQPGCLYRGTQVVGGVAHMIVTDVGDATYLGRIARRLSRDSDDADTAESEKARVKRKLTISKELTPLQQKLARLANLIGKVGYAAAGLIFAAQLVRGLITAEIFWPTTDAELLAVLRELLGYFVAMVIVIVVAVPEGLPMSVTVSLALAMRKMTRANSLVRQLVACETIGSATVICTDKTGTLTQNKMRVDRISVADAVWDRESPDWPKPAPDGQRNAIDWVALISAVNSTANLEEKQGKTITIGNSTEGSLLQWLRESGIEYGELRLRYPAKYQIHFSSERKRMTTVVEADGQDYVLVKGAPEALLGNSKEYLSTDGAPRALNEEMRSSFQAKLQAAAAKAMRTLAFAYAPLDAALPIDDDGIQAVRSSLERNLVYVGFVGIRDPLRDDVKAAIAECRDAGIDVKMITGDNVETARAIGHEIGLVSRADEPIDEPGAAVVTSQHFEAMSDEDLKRQLPKLRIIARAKPLDKYRLVKLLQELGEVVAVTGDGTNDAPALKRADVGLAMGIAGTEVSKEASKIVLLDDAFSTIVNAVHWGRSLYENIQRFIQFQLTINVSALAITFLGVLFFGIKAPFTVLQLLWINVIMDTFASIALCSEPPRPDVMKLPPKKRDENILTRSMVANIFGTAGFFIAVMLTFLGAMRYGRFADGTTPPPGQDLSIREATLFFSIYVFFQVWNQINARSLTPAMSGFQDLGKNPAFLTIAALVACGQFLIVTFGGRVFNVEPLAAWDWLLVIALTASVLVFAEIARRIRLAAAG
jgi:Ca2+-transporting ATPase